jgi:anion-transporting  ArsA/GET3 family ATPase
MSGGVLDVLHGRRVCVCAGSGGVGKTTTSAAVALGMAARGARVAVVTIDPARRLASALGLRELDNEPRLVDPELFAQAGTEMRGELWAMMLDPKRTFDELIERLAPDRDARDEVLGNRIYQQISRAVAGSQEYTAIAKLYDLHREGGYDLIVLDTPPTRNALDFLDAPDRLTQFLEGRALQTFLRSGGLGMRLMGRGTGLVLSVLERATGVDLLHDLSTFFRALSGMVGGFGERAHAVNALLRAPETTFLLVTSPEREPTEEAIWLHSQLRDARIPLGAVVVNRVHEDPAPDAAADDDGVRAALPDAVGPTLAERVSRSFHDFRALARRDAANIAALRRRVGGIPVLQIPHLDVDVHDVAGLARMRGFLFR